MVYPSKGNDTFNLLKRILDKWIAEHFEFQIGGPFWLCELVLFLIEFYTAFIQNHLEVTIQVLLL